MKLTRYFEADAYIVVVLAVSTVLFVACFCLLIRAYRRKHRSRGKQKELQRPFIKGKRSSLSPKKSPLLGNLQLYNGQTLTSKSSSKQQPILLPQKSSPVRTSIKAFSPNHSSDNSKLLEDKTWEPNFLGEVIASINQQQCQESSATKMLTRKKKMREPKVKFRSHNLSTGSGVHDHDGCVGSEGGDQSVEADVQISLGVDERGDNKTCRTDDPGGALPNQTAAKAEYDLTSSSDASQDMNSLELNVTNSAEQTTSVILTPEQGTSKLFRVKWKKPVTLLQSNSSALSSADISAQRRDQLWAHKCNCKSNLKKMTTRWMNRLHWKPSSVKGWAGDSSTNKDPNNAIQPHCNGDPRVESSVHVETTINKSFSQGNGHNGSTDSDRNSCANTCSSEDVSREHADSSQQTEGTRTVTADVKPDVCPHAIPNSASVASSAPKNEVYCRLCGMTLSKPQCFYSLGSLCTDEEICETDSDDINRHPVGDINVNIISPLVEVPAYNNDTGYTSTDEFENDLASDRLYERTDNGSYDGDYESDNEDTVDKQVAVGDDQVVKPLASIGEPIAIIDYALREWKSDTPTSQAMKKGYTSISSVVNCHHLRQIRGDNYCSIRAVLFQALVSGLPILNRFEAKKDSKLDQIPSRLSCSKDTRLDQWSFANRFPVPQAEVKATLENFLTFFGDQIHRILECCSGPERVDATLAMFSEETQEFKVLEATKLLMYDTAVELFDKFTSGQDVPVFAMLLFARDSSDLPRMLLKNHLNKTGDSGGLEQVEMCLLGYTLGVVIQVIRPSQVDKDDFIAYYPSLDDVPKYTPTVTLVAEDDRHYNIVL